jgi:molecular chaperone HscB
MLNLNVVAVNPLMSDSVSNSVPNLVTNLASNSVIHAELLKQDYFRLLNVPQQFTINLNVAKDAFMQWQKQTHPDRFSLSDATQQRLAMQVSTHINQGWQTLKHPLSRAIYLLQLQGVDCQMETNTAMSRTFLQQQMAWRETLFEIKASPQNTLTTNPLAARLNALINDVDQMRRDYIDRLATAFDEQQLPDTAITSTAITLTRELQFIEKFLAELNTFLD